MKTVIFSLLAVLAGSVAFGQGTFVYDQQSGDETHVQEGAVTFGMRPVQSFTPSLTSVDFVRLYVFLSGPIYGASVNLRSGAPDGPLVGSTLAIDQPGPFNGAINFRFETPVALDPGATYFIEPLVRLGTGQLSASIFYSYPGGMLSFGGVPDPTSDLWFREGIVVVPEPSSAALVLLAAGMWAGGWKRRHSMLSKRRAAIIKTCD